MNTLMVLYSLSLRIFWWVATEMLTIYQGLGTEVAIPYPTCAWNAAPQDFNLSLSLLLFMFYSNRVKAKVAKDQQIKDKPLWVVVNSKL